MNLPWDAVIAAITAALLHAIWNAALKGGNDRLLDASLLFAVAGVIGLISVLFVEPVSAEAWKWVAVTALLHIPYVYFLAKAYEIGELSHVYTIARGLPPVMVLALAGWAVGEVPDVTGLAGVAMISVGILVVGMTRGAHMQGTKLALIVAVSIALYTVSDGIGVRASGSPVAYNGWVFFACAVVCMTMAFVLRGRKVVSYARIYWRRALFGGVLSFVSYGLVLWAMTQASIAGISALRETSVVFAAVIGMLFLGEKAGAHRIAGALIVACGALLLKLG